MNAAFTPATSDVAWCAQLAEALSICCAATADWRVAEVRELLAAPPVALLTGAWDDLVNAGRAWLVQVDRAPGAMAPLFPGRKLIEAAERDLPVAVPVWAGRFQ